MKVNFLTFLVALFLLSVTGLGQLSNGGEVVDVIDGRTIVVATRSGRVKVELQFIEPPAAGHQLYDTVKGHLQKMLVGKVVEFRPRIIFSDRVSGRVLLNNVDVSQQMLRDGAATHVAKERSGQNSNEFDVYASLEAAAKGEKRGVWSTAGVAATRAENMNADPPRPVVAAVNPKGSSPKPPVPDVSQLLESWASSLPFDGNATTTNLQTHIDPSGAYKSISTPQAVLEFASESGKQTVKCRAVYAAANSSKGRGEPLFLLGFRSSFKKSDPLKGTGVMTVVAERYVVPLTALTSEAAETRYFRISRAFLMRIANTRSVEFQINGYKAILSDDAMAFFKQLLAATEKPS